MKKVCHFTSVHNRYDPRVFHKQCQSLSKKYDTYLLVADGLGSEIKNQIKIEDVGIRNSNIILRVLVTGFRIFKLANRLKADIYEFHDPELIPFGLLLRIMGKKVIFDMHEDMEKQLLIRPWVPRFLKKPLSKVYLLFERFFLRYFNAVFVPQEFMLKKYSKYFHTVLINNYLLDDFYPAVLPQKKVSKLLYVGSISRPRGIINLLNAIQDHNLTLTLVGSFSDKLLENEVKNHQSWKKVDFKGFISFEDVRKLYFNDYIGIIPFSNLGQYGHPFIIKLFEYMAFGLPIIMPKHGDWLRFNNDFKVGINTNTEDPKEFSQAIDKLINQDVSKYSENGITAVKKSFLWSSIEKKLMSCYSSIIN